MRPVPMTRLTSVGGSFAAHVLAARLTDEGLDVELRGAVGSPYGLTVGDMARVDLYVPDDQLDDARMVLLSIEVDDADPDRDLDDAPPTPRTMGWFAWAVLGAVLIATVAPILRWWLG